MSVDKKDRYLFFTLVALSVLAVAWYFWEKGERSVGGPAWSVAATDSLTMVHAKADTVITPAHVEKPTVKNKPIMATALKDSMTKRMTKAAAATIADSRDTTVFKPRAKAQTVHQDSAEEKSRIKKTPATALVLASDKKEASTVVAGDEKPKQQAEAKEKVEDVAPAKAEQNTAVCDSVQKPPAPAVVADKPAAPRQFTPEQQRVYAEVLNLVKEKIVLSPQSETAKADSGSQAARSKEVLLAANLVSEKAGMGVAPVKRSTSPNMPRHGIGLAGGMMQSLSRSGKIASWQGEIKYLRQMNPRVLFQTVMGLAPVKLADSGTMVTGDLASKIMLGDPSRRLLPTLSFAIGLAYIAQQGEKSFLAGTCTAGSGANLRLSSRVSLEAEVQIRQFLNDLTDSKSLDRDSFIAVKIGVNFFFNGRPSPGGKVDENLMARSE